MMKLEPKLEVTKDTDSDPKFQMTKEVRDKRFLMVRSRRKGIGGIIQSNHNKEDGDVVVIYKKEAIMRKKMKPTETVIGKIVQAIMDWDKVIEELIDNKLIGDSDSMELTIRNMTLYLQSKFPGMRNIGPRFSETSCALEALKIFSKLKRGKFYICSIDSNKLKQLSFDQLYQIVIGKVTDTRIKRVLAKKKLEEAGGKRKDGKKKVIKKKVVKKKVKQPKKSGKMTLKRPSKRTIKIFEGPARITGININCNDDGLSLEIRFKE